MAEKNYNLNNLSFFYAAMAMVLDGLLLVYPQQNS